jgi:nucleotide-binding universal stress UspA family protein
MMKGEPAEALAEAGDDLDLLVAGSRGYGPMRHVLLGSVSARLMRTCPCPLIVVPRGMASPKPDTEALTAESSRGV